VSTFVLFTHSWNLALSCGEEFIPDAMIPSDTESVETHCSLGKKAMTLFLTSDTVSLYDARTSVKSVLGPGGSSTDTLSWIMGMTATEGRGGGMSVKLGMATGAQCGVPQAPSVSSLLQLDLVEGTRRPIPPFSGLGAKRPSPDMTGVGT
jgi:hypothetical protein